MHWGLRPVYWGLRPMHWGLRPVHGGLRPMHRRLRPVHRSLRPMHGGRHRKIGRSRDVAGSVLLEVRALVGPLLVTDNFDLQ